MIDFFLFLFFTFPQCLSPLLPSSPFQLGLVEWIYYHKMVTIKHKKSSTTTPI
ncbi:hypothetical protein LguiB_020555 [Lonicera macranthoides]